MLTWKSPIPLLASKEQVFSKYTETKSVLSAARQNAHSHPPPVAKHFGPLLNQSLAISALPVSRPYAVPLVILFVSHTQQLRLLTICFLFTVLPISLATSAPIDPLLLLPISTGKIHQAPPSLNYSKPSNLKMFPFNRHLLFVTSCLSNFSQAVIPAILNTVILLTLTATAQFPSKLLFRKYLKPSSLTNCVCFWNPKELWATVDVV